MLGILDLLLNEGRILQLRRVIENQFIGLDCSVTQDANKIILLGVVKAMIESHIVACDLVVHKCGP